MKKLIKAEMKKQWNLNGMKIELVLNEVGGFHYFLSNSALGNETIPSFISFQANNIHSFSPKCNLKRNKSNFR